MSSEEAIAAALAVEIAPGAQLTTRSPQRYPAGLTHAEAQVLRRLAAGLKTREIGVELVIAVSTVDRHITHIYDKIGGRGRAAATAFALKHDLL
jgi:DNA-binding CsgD family transcriptional regulator